MGDGINWPEILCCPDCRSDVVEEAGVLGCETCGREFPCLDGILRMLPTESLDDRRGVDDPNFQRWLELSSELSRDYFEKGNRLFYATHHSSHRAIDRFVRDNCNGKYILDLGCGAGAHYPYHGDLPGVVGVDINLNSLELTKRAFPKANLVHGDIYKLPFKNGAFETVMSIYNLEHIFYLDAALTKVSDVLAKNGHFLIGLPCEGGFMWNLGRALTSARTIPKKYGIDYKKVIAIEHCNTAAKVLDSLKRQFEIVRRWQFPSSVLPSLDLNLTVTLACKHRPNS